MSDIVVEVENLGKLYHIGKVQERYMTLRDTIATTLAKPIHLFRSFRSTHQGGETLWALRDVSFKIRRGEVVGIVGRNGAGKSTLLKILSRITEPTQGRVVIRGRVGSLLEVGTGFHPELTGRENVYLNGAILGMKRKEIEQKFDQIVAFAEVEKFIDTPVKHFSSGMYLRLAFAVAAHLEPEILLIDEVLAIGDAAFQKKCLGKMGNVAQEGQTVLFVSHNMGAIVSLCNRCLLIEQGSLTQDGNPSQVTGVYQTSLYSTNKDPSDLSGVERYGSGKAKFLSAKVIPMGTNVSSQTYLHTGQDLKVELKIKATAEIVQANVALIIYDSAGYRLIDVNTALQGSFLSLKAGEGAQVIFYLRDVLLKPGVYLLGLWIGRKSIEDIDGITHATSISVEADPETLKYSETFPGVYQCRYSHYIEKVDL
jgi:lipopolysaccharide transport system ATP-binding protein